MSTSNTSVYDRGGADYCEAIIHDNALLTQLNALFTTHQLCIIAVDGSFSTKKTVNITLFLQTDLGQQPNKVDVVNVLTQFELQPMQYVLTEATLIVTEDIESLPCLALTFQGDDATKLARDKLPVIVALEENMHQIVSKNANKLLAKVRVMATDAIHAMGIFNKKTTSSQSSKQQTDLTETEKEEHTKRFGR